MRLKLLILSLFALTALNSYPAQALAPTEATSEKYLIDHGHSPEVVRMINLQKDRIEGSNSVQPPTQGKAKKFFKNLWFEKDMTMSLNDFGYNQVDTVETQKSQAIPVIKSLKDKYTNKNKDDSTIPNNETGINDVKVRGAEEKL